MNGQRADQVIVDDHVAGQVAPLIERASQFLFLLARPGMFGFEGQFPVHVHLVPTDLVDPGHRADRLPTIELLPEHGLFLVDGQGGNPGQFAGEAAQDVFVPGA